MKDAFGNKLSEGDRVIYSVKGGSGTEYVIGKISGTLPRKQRDNWMPDRVTVQVEKTSNRTKFAGNPIVYASNVILISALKEKS